MNKLKVGDRFAMGRIVCQVDEVEPVPESGLGVQHYRFSWRSDSGELKAGWMPVEFVDNFTGHLAK